MSDVVAHEVTYLEVRRGSDASGLLSPPRSPRRHPVSPPPSSSLLKLQQLGLELGPSSSSLSLHAPSYNSSIRTTPSDLDKPLPLEPPEISRRASSVYSVSTTISNIISLYGGHGFDDTMGSADRAQAYRDTVAPLMARRYSGAESPPLLPLIVKRTSGAESPPPLPDYMNEHTIMLPSMPSPSIYQDITPPMSPNVPEMPPLPSVSPGIYPTKTSTPPSVSPSIYPISNAQHRPGSLSAYPEISPPLSPAESKTAPSFSEFTRNLSQKRGDIVSPLSSEGSEGYHRHLALAALAPPSLRESPNMHPVTFEKSDSYLPGPMSGTISHVASSDMVPPPLDLSRASRSISPPTAAQRAQYERENNNSFEDFLQEQARKNSSIVSSRDKFNASPRAITPPEQHYHSYQEYQQPQQQPETLTSQRFTDSENYRIMSYAAEKYPGMAPPQAPPNDDSNPSSSTASAPPQKPKRASTLSISTSKAAGAIMRAMSVRKSVESSKTHKTSGTAETSFSDATATSASTAYTPPRAHLAIQPTSYQLYGEASWEKYDGKNKKKRGVWNKRRSTKDSETDVGEGGKGAGGGGGVLQGVKHKLTRSASEKRREQLKESIRLVGTTELTKGTHAREDPRRWWEQGGSQRAI